jgi:hypothetical protein
VALVGETLGAPLTWLTLVVAAAGMGVWVVRQRRSKQGESYGWFDALVESGFGFEPLNGQVAAWVQRTASFVQKTQTGQLNWNILGIVAALLTVLALLWWGV